MARGQRGQRGKRGVRQLDAGTPAASSVFARAAEIQAARRDGDTTDVASLIEVGSEVGLEPFSVMSAYAETSAAAELARHRSLHPHGETVSVERMTTAQASVVTSIAASHLERGGLTMVSAFGDRSVWIPVDGSDHHRGDAVGQLVVELLVGHPGELARAAESVVVVAVEHEGSCLVRIDAIVGASLRAKTRRDMATSMAWAAAWGSLGAVSVGRGFDVGDLIWLGIAACVGSGAVKQRRHHRAEATLLAGRVRVALNAILDDIGSSSR